MKTAVYTDCLNTDRLVQNLDPLRMDDFLASELPKLNVEKRVGPLIELARKLVPTPDTATHLSSLEAMAAIRDLNMVASSLRRHEVNFDAVPNLEPALLVLANQASEVPSDTVTSYGPRNPEGSRMRAFTPHHEERLFIDSFRSGMNELLRVVEALETAQCLTIIDVLCGSELREAERRFQAMMTAIVAVRRHITPQFFTDELRPYFEPKVIGGRKYFAPGGAQMSLILVDQLLWGIAQSDGSLASYYQENLEYQPALLRARERMFVMKPPLVQQVVLRFVQGDVENVTLSDAQIIRQSLTAIEQILVAVEQFRVIHLRIARDNMAIRPLGSVGSGGYDTKLLTQLLEKTTNARGAIATLLEILS